MSYRTDAGPSTLHRSRIGEDTDLNLAARLTLEDIREIEQQQAPMTDAALALRLAAQEARSSLIFETDRALAQSLQDVEVRPLRPASQQGFVFLARNAFLS